MEQHRDVLLREEEIRSSKWLVSFLSSPVANFMQEHESSRGRGRSLSLWAVLQHICSCFEGHQLPEAGKLLGSLRLEDLVQSGVSPPDDAAVRLCFPLPQRCHQLPAQDGRAVHAPGR